MTRKTTSTVSSVLIVCMATTLPLAAQSDWSPVRRVRPGTEIIVTAKGRPEANRYFIAADDSNLTVLNVEDPGLPDSARKVLRDVASTHPDYFSDAENGRQFVFENDVRLGPDGVFIAARKVADLGHIVEHYRQPGVAEIRTASTESNPVGCALVAHYGGAVIGGLPGAVVGGAIGRDTGPTLVGMVAGWSVGAVYLYRRCRHKPERVLYPAP